ncbi:MAG: copper chaperone PCu(A)C [Vicinamibacterales bacterium]
MSQRTFSILTAAIAAVVISSSLALAQTPAVTVHDAWVREPMGGRNMTGAFAVVELERHDQGDRRRLVDISDKVELHEMKNENGMMKMSPVKKVDVPAKGKVELKPGSFHVMLFEVKKKIADGEKISLTFTFDDGSKVTTEAQVRKAGTMQ